MKIKTKLIDHTLVEPQPSYIVPRFADALFLRWNAYDFMKEIASIERNCSVLEIGPHSREGYSTIPYKGLVPEFYSLGDNLKENGCDYISCDLKKTPEVTMVWDAFNLLDVLEPNSLDVIIALEVMEHMDTFWQLPELFHTLLRDKGRIYISVPFFVHHHDPKPDYWRFTEDGLNLLFGEKFDIEITKLLQKADNGQTPIHYTLVGRKKNV